MCCDAAEIHNAKTSFSVLSFKSGVSDGRWMRASVCFQHFCDRTNLQDSFNFYKPHFLFLINWINMEQRKSSSETWTWEVPHPFSITIQQDSTQSKKTL